LCPCILRIHVDAEGALIDLLLTLPVFRVQSGSPIEEHDVLFDGIAPDAQLVGRQLGVGMPDGQVTNYRKLGKSAVCTIATNASPPETPFIL
jgi:hypothetical protein